MSNGTIRQTELAAALFHMIGGTVPHPYEREAEARALAEQLGDRSKILHKVVELCGTPTTPKQLFLVTRAYSFLGNRYAKETEKAATAYLATAGWQELPHRTVYEEGIPVNGAAAGRACIVSELAAAEEHLGKLEAAISHYLEAYRLEPYRAMYAVKAADGMVKLGRKEEALTFLRQQKENRYYTPVKYRDAQGQWRQNDTFRELLNAQILKFES